ncbi:MAG: hypothetical protein WCI72_05720 [archaeon]
MGKTLGIICKEFDFGELLKDRFGDRTTFENIVVANPGDANFSYDCTHYLVHLGERDLDLTPLVQRNPNAKMIVFSTKTATREACGSHATVYDSAMSAWRACEREAPKEGINYKNEVYGEE